MQHKLPHPILVDKSYAVWKTSVRDYELDFQNIVNNANYLHYLHEARNLYLNQLGLSVTKFAEQNINFVLIDTHLRFKKSLKSND